MNLFRSLFRKGSPEDKGEDPSEPAATDAAEASAPGEVPAPEEPEAPTDGLPPDQLEAEAREPVGGEALQPPGADVSAAGAGSSHRSAPDVEVHSASTDESELRLPTDEVSAAPTDTGWDDPVGDEWADDWDESATPVEPSRTAADLVLFQYETCPLSRRVRRALHRLGVEVQQRDVLNEPDSRRELIAGTGDATVPCLMVQEEGDAVRWLRDARQIIAFLEQRFG